jgi:hypothetical protein
LAGKLVGGNWHQDDTRSFDLQNWEAAVNGLHVLSGASPWHVQDMPKVRQGSHIYPISMTSITGDWSEVSLCELFMNSGIER